MILTKADSKGLMRQKNENVEKIIVENFNMKIRNTNTKLTYLP